MKGAGNPTTSGRGLAGHSPSPRALCRLWSATWPVTPVQSPLLPRPRPRALARPRIVAITARTPGLIAARSTGPCQRKTLARHHWLGITFGISVAFAAAGAGSLVHVSLDSLRFNDAFRSGRRVNLLAQGGVDETMRFQQGRFRRHFTRPHPVDGLVEDLVDLRIVHRRRNQRSSG